MFVNLFLKTGTGLLNRLYTWLTSLVVRFIAHFFFHIRGYIVMKRKWSNIYFIKMFEWEIVFRICKSDHRIFIALWAKYFFEKNLTWNPDSSVLCNRNFNDHFQFSLYCRAYFISEHTNHIRNSKALYIQHLGREWFFSGRKEINHYVKNTVFHMFLAY